jgi:hypothetical protein
MSRSLFTIAVRCFVPAALTALGTFAWAMPAVDKDPGILLGTMQGELLRAKTSLAKSDPAPYFLSYEVYDEHSMAVTGSYGTIMTSSTANRRWADVTMRG